MRGSCGREMVEARREEEAEIWGTFVARKDAPVLSVGGG